MLTLCGSCAYVREVVSGTGSTFLLCKLSQKDGRFSRYPPQPVVRCDGYMGEGISAMKFTLEALPGSFAVCRLDAGAEIPGWASGEVASITRTPDELSIVCLQENVPEDTTCESDWRCLRVAGPLDFSMVGVIASLTGILAAANISVFVISTFDTDLLLVKQGDLEAAVDVFAAAGHDCTAVNPRSSRENRARRST